MEYSQAVQTARTYYNSDDADRFYATVWGGEDLHIGIYDSQKESIKTASQRTVERIANKVALNSETLVLDAGAGYGGSARYIAKRFGCTVDCLNLSEIQNKRNRDMNQDQGLTKKINVIDGSFEDIPAKDDFYDVVWSQDSFLHSGQRDIVISESARVLKTEGELIFTDPMQSDDCPAGVLQPVLDRIHLDTMGSPDFYKNTASKYGLEFISFDEQTPHLMQHYTRVLQELDERYEEITANVSEDYVKRMQAGLKHWIEAGSQGYLKWGILHFHKK